MLFLVLIFISPLKASVAKEPLIRVLIANQNKASFRADRLKSISLKGISPKQPRIKSIKLIYNNGQTKYSINDKRDKWMVLPNDFNLIIKNNDTRGIWFDNRRYAGELRVSLNNKKLQITNYLKLEKYLKSVVGSEMPKEFPIAALQAQAVAARTYALQLLGKNKLFDVHSTEANQVYLGLEAETPKINRAVRTTNSLVLFYEGKLINAVFHSSSGGRTEDSGQVWKYQFPYLISVVDYDQNSSKYRWSRKFSSDELAQIFADLGGVKNMQIIKKSNSNRVLKVIIYGTYGKKIISGKDLRKKLQLESTKFETYMKFNLIKETNKSDRITYSNDRYNFVSDELILKDFPLQSLPKIPEDYFLLIKGFGSGHGVGMSQWGAKEMAERGASFRKILKHYYRGVKIKSF